MTTQVLELNEAQSLIYTRTNIRRAFKDFDDTDVGGIYLFDDQCRIVYRDGAQVDYPRQQIKVAYKDFTDRLPDFFSYLGPNYMGPTIWHNSSLVLFKGWSYVHASGKHTFNAKLQQRWADKLMRITDEQQLKQLLQSDQTDIGYLVAPEGFRYTNQRWIWTLNWEKTSNQSPSLLNLSAHVGPFNVSSATYRVSNKRSKGSNPGVST